MSASECVRSDHCLSSSEHFVTPIILPLPLIICMVVSICALFSCCAFVAKKKKDTPVERKRKQRERRASSRAKETPEKKNVTRKKNSDSHALIRENESPERRSSRLKDQCERRRTDIDKETPEKKNSRQQQDRKRHQQVIDEEESPEKREFRLLDLRQRERIYIEKRLKVVDVDKRKKIVARNMETEEQKADRQSKDLARYHKQIRVPRSSFEARKIRDIEEGIQIVRPHYFGGLVDEDGNPRDGSKKCKHCDAVLWKGELESFCCNKGKINLKRLWNKVDPDDPIYADHTELLEVFKELWKGNHRFSKLFLENVRSFNNALCLASLKATRTTPPGGGWKPTVVIQGKVAILMGPLRPTDGRAPVFAQVYVLDPVQREEELKLRVGSVYLKKKPMGVEKKMIEDLMKLLQKALHQVNDYVKDFKQAVEIIDETEPEQLKLIIDANKRPGGEHKRKFNEGFKEISVVMEQDKHKSHDFVIQSRGPGNHIEEISDINRAADPLRYPLLFPDGIDGYHLEQHQNPDDDGSSRCSGREFYAYHIQIRDPLEKNFTPLHWGRDNFQEYLCCAWAGIEHQKLKWYEFNQNKIRREKYQKLFDDLHPQDAEIADEKVDAKKLGQMVILPPSFPSGPRYMHKQYQDAMAIVRTFGRPHLFITMTCNPKWSEITESLWPQQQAWDRPDLVTRVFKQKLAQFHKDIIQKGYFGKVLGHVNVTEFQKRGLPHNHLVVILDPISAINTAQHVDDVISAELPPSPDNFPEGPQKEQAKKLLELVKEHMIHECSARCKTADSKDSKKCSKKFPQDFCEETKWYDDMYYPLYRRREQKERKETNKHGKPIDNSMVVPYNAYFLLKYECHINVECCISITSVKYLYKYVYKGSDHVMLAPDLDEIKIYQNLRSIGACEACWRIFKFGICDRHPPVQALRIHLENEEVVYFQPENAEAIVDAGPKRTELTAFFDFNKLHPQTKVKYVDFPLKHTWLATQRKWKGRDNGVATIGRIHGVHPISGEVFYLRILLHHEQCKGKCSFEEMRTVEGTTYATYKETCAALGLLQDDGEWDHALKEAAETNMAYQIRRLYIVMLLFCDLTDPLSLYAKHSGDWADDFERKYPPATKEELQNMVLLDLEEKLQEKGKCLADYKLPSPSEEDRNAVSALQKEKKLEQSVALREELQFEVEDVLKEKERMERCLNEDQLRFYKEVMRHIENGQSGAFFLNARGGTGKTFLLTTLLHAARTLGAEKCVAIAVASSGIAAILLPQGKTFHSRFKAPIHFVDARTTLNIQPNDTVAKVLVESTVIVWDEGPMMSKFLLEALDRTLRDITKVNKIFGGKILVVAGDFRQVLPIIEHGSRAQICEASFRNSNLWKFFKQRELRVNMRVGTDTALQEFDAYLEDMGDGNLPVEVEPDWVELPSKSVFTIDDRSPKTISDSMTQFIDMIFPDLEESYLKWKEKDWIKYASERAILTPKNIQVDTINQKIVRSFPGKETIAYSADSACDEMDALQYPVEFLNLIAPSGIPPHELILKKGIILMLIRNLNSREGLCNGTRLILVKPTKFLLQCKIASGKRCGDTVLIPRLELTIDNGDLPFGWKRRQFPVRPAFAITINKSQGQTLKKVGVWLEDPCFSHGQLYVASSRVGNPTAIHYAIKESDGGLTRNVVFHEAFGEMQGRVPQSNQRAAKSPRKIVPTKTNINKGKSPAKLTFKKGHEAFPSATKKIDCGKQIQKTTTKCPKYSAVKVSSTQSFSRPIFQSSVPSIPETEPLPEWVGDHQRDTSYEFRPPNVQCQRTLCIANGLEFIQQSRYDNGSVGRSFKPNRAPTKSHIIKNDTDTGNCFFRAVCFILTGGEEQHMMVRRLICDWIEDHGVHLLDSVEDGHQYLEFSEMREDGKWATENEIFATADWLGISVYCWSRYGDARTWSVSKPRRRVESAPYGIYIDNFNNDHYNVVTSIVPPNAMFLAPV